MPSKRKKASTSHFPAPKPRKTLFSGRGELSGNAAWGWVGAEVQSTRDIGPGHIRRAYHLDRPLCGNFYDRSIECIARGVALEKEEEEKAKEVARLERRKKRGGKATAEEADESASRFQVGASDVKGKRRAEGEHQTVTVCDAVACVGNPNCLNHLGQRKWFEDVGVDAFLEATNIGSDLSKSLRSHVPVGLRNLGATCYCNAFLQVWYQDLSLREGVYKCRPPGLNDGKDSPIFQLQVIFTALQEGLASTFDPQRFVTSLQLTTSEQQDAQEFSKLFMNLLDKQFRKQDDPVLQTLLSDQFEGQQSYCTKCHKCKTVSQRSSAFLELELPLKENATVEELINRMLEPETLSGTNQYACSVCNSLQNADRYVQLDRIPPVLHLSLLRFAFDAKTGDRKKSRNRIRFPSRINMARFLNHGSGDSIETPEDVYELRGVVYHVGSSAYHGHYIADAVDVQSGQWYTFDDELVKPIDELSDQALDETMGTRKESNTPQVGDTSTAQLSRPSEMSDSPGQIAEEGKRYIGSQRHAQGSAERQVQVSYKTSRNAYMLIYARRSAPTSLFKSVTADGPTKEFSTSAEVNHGFGSYIASDPRPHDNVEGGSVSSSRTAVPTPPAEALLEVQRLNAELQERISTWKGNKERLKQEFEKMRRDKAEVVRLWRPEEEVAESVFVGEEALRSWLEQGLVKKNFKSTSADTGQHGTGDGQHDGIDNGSASTSRFNEGNAALDYVNEDRGTEQHGGEDSLGSRPSASAAHSDLGSSGEEPVFVRRIQKNDPTPSTDSEAPAHAPVRKGPADDDLLCPHEKLSPLSAGRVKRLSVKGYQALEALQAEVGPALPCPEALCEVCVGNIFQDRLDRATHKGHLEAFATVNTAQAKKLSTRTYWVSHTWLQDWKAGKMRNKGEQEGKDLPPDAPEYRGDVVCPHGNMTPSRLLRRDISIAAFNVLANIFPSWSTFTSEDEACKMCSGDRKEHVELAQEEKADLRNLAIRGAMAPIEMVVGEDYYLVSSEFFDAWRTWVQRPMEHDRPNRLDNSALVCEHSLLLLDVNSAELSERSRVSIVRASDWAQLAARYDGSPVVRVRLQNAESEVSGFYVSNPAACTECHRRARAEFVETDVFFCLLESDDPLPLASPVKDDGVGGTSLGSYPLIPVTGGEPSFAGATEPMSRNDVDDDGDVAPSRGEPTTTNNGRKRKVSAGTQYGRRGQRKSRRIAQQAKGEQDHRKPKRKEKVVRVKKTDTVKDLKVKVNEIFSIPTIYQRLFHNGRELEDNEDQVASLGILRRDVIWVMEVMPIEERLSGLEEGGKSGKDKGTQLRVGGKQRKGGQKRGEERGFDGTALLNYELDAAIAASLTEAGATDCAEEKEQQ